MCNILSKAKFSCVRSHGEPLFRLVNIVLYDTAYICAFIDQCSFNKYNQFFMCLSPPEKKLEKLCTTNIK